MSKPFAVLQEADMDVIVVMVPNRSKQMRKAGNHEQ